MIKSLSFRFLRGFIASFTSTLGFLLAFGQVPLDFFSIGVAVAVGIPTGIILAADKGVRDYKFFKNL